MSLTSEIIFERTGLNIVFKTEEQLYALQDLLNTALPARAAVAEPVAEPVAEAAPAAEAAPVAAPVAAPEPKKVKKAKKAPAPAEPEAEVALLAPVDAVPAAAAAPDAATDAPVLGATDSLRDNKYRLTVLNPTFCCGRKIDEANTIVGTRPGDDGANGKVFPEIQCSKKPVAGSRLCAICAKNEAEYLANPTKPGRWRGRLDEPLFARSFVVGCEWFWSKYPEGIEGARPAAAAAAVAEVAAEKPKKTKKAKSAKAEEPAAAAAAAEPVAEPVAEPAADKPKKVKKAKAEKAEAAEEVVAEAEAPAPAPMPRKVAVAADGAAKEVEWVTFIVDGTVLIRHTKTANVYQCDRSKHRLEDMVQRDKFEGKWRDGRLDPYADEEDE